MKRRLGFVRWQNLEIGFSVIGDDLAHVVLSLAIRRHAVVLVHGAFAGIVASQREGDVTVEPFQQPG